MSQELAQSPAIDILNDARDGYKKAVVAVMDAQRAERDAVRHRQYAERALGAAIRGLRHHLNLSASDVARGASGYWNPADSLRSYVEMEDGQSFDSDLAAKVADYLAKKSVRAV